MKANRRTAILLLLFFVSAVGVFGQSKMIILVRHAEKDAVQSETSDDPGLSAEGVQRAERLVQKIKRYRPGAIYSSNYLRTLDTVGPMAKRRHLKVQIYDPRKQDDLVKQLMASKTKRFLIVGHSNTIPALANLLINKDLFKTLDESEYRTIWIVRFRHGRFSSVRIFYY